MKHDATIFVFGAGGHGKVVADIALARELDVAGFIDDAHSERGTPLGLPVISFEHFLRDAGHRSGVRVALGIGDNSARQRSFERLVSSGWTVTTLVHPRAIVSPSAVIGEGVVIMAGAVVNPDARVADGAILNTGAVVEHDCVVGRFAHLSPNAALGGAVHVGDRSHVGLGAVVLPTVRVGADVRVGAGASVIRSVRDGLTVVGVPARPLKSKEEPS